LSESAGPEVISGPGANLVTITGGGSLGVFSVANTTTGSITGVTISGGSAASGGGIDNKGALTLAIDVFSNNAAVNYGGAVYNEAGATLTVSNTTFSNNTATYGQGGSIDNAGTLSVSASTFAGGFAFAGGAIDVKGGSLTVTNSTFTQNVAIEGGGIFNNAQATITGSTIANNVTTQPPPGTSPVNFTSFDGGGIANDLAGNLTLINSTVANNAAGQYGGGIDNVGIFTAVNDTIAANNVAGGGSGGGVYATIGTAIFYNTIIAQNTNGSGKATTPSDIAGLVSMLSSNNLIGAGSGGLTNNVKGNLVGITSPGLGTLANNGGPTQTIALLAGSPAINAGSNALAVVPGGAVLSTDQRGAAYPRIVNTTVDIGAFESGTASVYTVNSTTASGASTSPTAGDLVFAVTQANTNSNPSGTVISFDPTVFSATSPQTITLGAPLVLSGTGGTETITGPGTAALTISGGGNVGVFQVAIGTTASITDATISGGMAVPTNGGVGGSGGGIDNSGTLTVNHVAVTGNSALVGGGIANEQLGTLTVNNSTLSGNSAASGGAIYNLGTFTATNTTIAGNSGFIKGAGIFNMGTVTMVNSTIAYNVASTGGVGGGLDSASASTSLFNTIVALNTVGSGASATASDIAGNVASASASNLIGTGGSGGLTNKTNGNQVGVANPLLGPLANNGGPTQTIALLVGSPAIGAGSATIAGVAVPQTDQRGNARPATAIDIGAYQSLSVVVAPGVIAGSPATSTPVAYSVSAASASSSVAAASPVAVAPGPKRVVGAGKALPHGRLAAKFHGDSRLGSGHKSQLVLAKHSSARAKQKS
jgi:hypothetical protein